MVIQWSFPRMVTAEPMSSTWQSASVNASAHPCSISLRNRPRRDVGNWPAKTCCSQARNMPADATVAGCRQEAGSHPHGCRWRCRRHRVVTHSAQCRRRTHRASTGAAADGPRQARPECSTASPGCSNDLPHQAITGEIPITVGTGRKSAIRCCGNAAYQGFRGGRLSGIEVSNVWRADFRCLRQAASTLPRSRDFSAAI